jgi:hypothetical protein
VIDHQRVGLADQARGAQGEQLGVAGAGADQGHAAHRAGVGCPRRRRVGGPPRLPTHWSRNERRVPVAGRARLAVTGGGMAELPES